MSGPLSDLRVVDFGHYIAGPLAAMMLADQGADVIHVDRPGGPALTGPHDALMNRNKRRVTLDLKTLEGHDAAARLIAGADVVIENFRPGVLDRLGISLAGERAADPRLITCSLPGFAADDPRAAMRAWEGVLQAATANCRPRTGEEPEGWDWSRPFFTALPFASNFAAYLGATSVVMAAIARRRTGRGQHVEVPLFDAMFQLIGHSGAYVAERGIHDPAPIHGRGSGAFRCGDGRYVQFDTSAPRHLLWFAAAAGVAGTWDPELLDLAKNRDPEINKRLTAALSELFLTKSAEEWESIGQAAGAAIGFIRTAGEWLENEHAQATRTSVRIEDPEIGSMLLAGLPVGLSDHLDLPITPRELPGATAELAWEERPERAASYPEDEPDLEAPLSGMTVVDIGVALAGPTCGRMLAEFGAHVIKVAAPESGVGGYLNRGKDSLLLDLALVAGQDVYWRLVDQADVVLENLSPGTTDRIGIGYPYLSHRRPEAVYTSISCYGRGGPWEGNRGWERQGQAVAGIMERTALPSVLGPYNIVDIGTGILGTFATSLGIYDRQTTGHGQMVSASLAQTATYHQTAYAFSYPGYASHEARGYDALGDSPLNRYYQGADQWFFLAAQPSELAAVAAASGSGDLSSLGEPELEKALESAFAGSTADESVERLRQAGVSAHRVIDLPELMVDPDVVRRGLAVTQEVAGTGACVMPGVSPRLSDTPARVAGHPHQPGSDAATILASIGLGDRLDALETSWVVRTHDLPRAWS